MTFGECLVILEDHFKSYKKRVYLKPFIRSKKVKSCWTSKNKELSLDGSAAVMKDVKRLGVISVLVEKVLRKKKLAMSITHAKQAVPKVFVGFQPFASGHWNFHSEEQIDSLIPDFHVGNYLDLACAGVHHYLLKRSCSSSK